MNSVRIKEEFILSDITLNKNEEIEIYVNSNIPNFIKICNVQGKLVLFIKDKNDIIIEEWHGAVPYHKTISKIEDSILGYDD